LGCHGVQIGKLKLLTELQVFGNKLTALPATLGHCNKLQLLHAGGNQITAFPVELCACLINLTELFLYKNAVGSAVFFQSTGWFSLPHR
jgi:Leucine-rich repeat (LRR) protein